jgi:uncharacterized protein YecT (DUF1311 family)
MKFLWSILLLAFAQNTARASATHNISDPIEEKELGAFLAEQNGCDPDQIYFSSLDQYDFLGKGYKQAVVVASTCMTGTAGPDVHGVYTRNESGELKELKMEEVKLPHRVLFGNANSRFRLEDGIIVEEYGDTSDREFPLVIRYKWDGAKQQFSAVSAVAARPYTTSYDCNEAEKDGDETALAICYVKPLADLDLRLAQTYKAYLATLAPSAKRAAVEEQRDWLSERNKKCTIYKWWVDCLTESYNARITELRTRVEKQTKPTPPTGG